MLMSSLALIFILPCQHYLFYIARTFLHALRQDWGLNSPSAIRSRSDVHSKFSSTSIPEETTKIVWPESWARELGRRIRRMIEEDVFIINWLSWTETSVMTFDYSSWWFITPGESAKSGRSERTGHPVFPWHSSHPGNSGHSYIHLQWKQGSGRVE